ncbi:MAG: DEAD/DEAH box helicase family protein [Tuberibacillus sp.]
MKPVLENMVSGMDFDHLPENWTTYNVRHFSVEKQMFRYQQNAVKNAIKALYLFYEQIAEFEESESVSIHLRRKRDLYERYAAFDEECKKLATKRNKQNEYLFKIYEDYYDFEDRGSVLGFYHFINRMAFSMATGSGKSLLIVKIMDLLHFLMRNKEIPRRDILLLAPREDLLNQTKKLIHEFNKTPGNPFIQLVNLKDYEAVKNENRLDLGEITVFYYRSDLISDEKTEAFVNYRDYDNQGGWYILLDEAHKGGKDNSKRQAYYSILSRNGYLFNFSATFTDPTDTVTTVKNYDVIKFNHDGYGKNLYVSRSEFTPFKDNGDIDGESKTKITLKSLIALSLTKLAAKAVKQVNSELYHSPLMVALVNSVNKKDSDLQMFFNELLRFASGHVEEALFNEAKDELERELLNEPEWTVGDGKLKFASDFLIQITPETVLKEVFNTERYGGIEVIRSDNDKEVAFRIKTSNLTSDPFALIKIGNVSEWEKEMLQGYDFLETFEKRSYFDRLNESDHINILMGSRSFYEGWDSNRPNILNYINIGASGEAKKFLLQSIGRGIRLEPLSNQRKRLKWLLNENKISASDYNSIRAFYPLLETLFIFSSNKDAIEHILGLSEEFIKEKRLTIELDQNDADFPLFIPSYKKIEASAEGKTKFQVSGRSLDRLKDFIGGISDQVMFLQYGLRLDELKALKEAVIDGGSRFIQENDDYHYKDIETLIQRLSKHLKQSEQVVSGFTEVSDEIQHFKEVKVSESEAEAIHNSIQQVIKAKDSENIDEDELINLLLEAKITREEFKQKQAAAHSGQRSLKYKDLTFMYHRNHFYTPLILSEKENVDYINHVISYESEVEFIKKLNEFVERHEKAIAEKYDHWMFSKLDETVDQVFIPYFDDNRYKKFKPDFIFWYKKGNQYKILFVDPKGTEHSSWMAKVDGFINAFEGKTFKQDGLNLTVHLKLFSTKKTVNGKYEDYWSSTIDELFEL